MSGGLAANEAWIEECLAALKAVMPGEATRIYGEAGRAEARDLVAAAPASRVPSLVEALFESYDRRADDAFTELMWLIEALYGALPKRISVDEACAILAATRHSCGHGGIHEPVALAIAAYGDDPFDSRFFDAVKTYQARLKGLTSMAVTSARGELALLLWQDPDGRLKPGTCLSRAARDGLFGLPPARRAKWQRLLRHVDRSAKRRPPKAWIVKARPALEVLGHSEFAADLKNWLAPREGRVPLSTGGRHVLKTMLWFAGLAQTDALDEAIPALIDQEYVKPEAAVHLIYAVGYWLEGRPPALAEPHRARLRAKWPLAGTRIRG